MPSFFSSLFGGGKDGTPAVNPNAPRPNPQPEDRGFSQNNPAANPATVPPSGTSQPTTEPISPLDEFKTLWQPNKTADGKPIPETPNPLNQPLLNTDSGKLAEASRKMNFTTGVDPQLVQKALSGDAEAFMTVLNHSTQNAFMAAAQLSTNMVEGAAKTNNSRFDSSLDERFKKFLAAQERSTNPILSHEAVAPIVDVYKSQLLKKYPEKTAGEIHQMAEQMMTNFATELLKSNEKKQQAESGSSTKDPFDFTAWG